MIGRLMAIALIAVSCLVCVPDANANGGGFSSRGRFFVPRSRVVVQNNFGGYGRGAFIPRSNVVFVPSGGYGYGGGAAFIRAPSYGYGFQSQVLFAPTTGGCYGGGGF